MDVNEIRVQKYVADCGLMSRRKAEEEILAGRIKVNGERVEQGRKIIPGVDRVEYMGRPVEMPRGKRYVYIMLNKPRGYVTTMNDELGRKCVASLVSDVGERVYPCGRLDLDSEGLLIMTNDGELAQRLTHPSCEVDKVYLARVTGNPSNEAIERMRRGVYMEGDERKTYPAEVRVVRDESLFSDIVVTIHEGRNRQVRRMFDAVGHKVLLLRRIRFGPLELGSLKRGEWRELDSFEIERLHSL